MSETMSARFRRVVTLIPYRDKTAVRWGWLILCGVTVAGFGGCASLNSMLRPAPKAPVIFETTPASASLVAAIEANASAVQQMESDIRLSMEGMPAAIRGKLLFASPDNLRLKAGVLGMTDSGIDIGSNRERFWIYNKSSLGGQSPFLLHARHDAFANSPVQRMLPIQPRWVIEALGMIDFDQFDSLEGPFTRDDGHLELRASQSGPHGVQHRLLVIDPQRGWVVQQAVYDANHRLVAWSQSDKFRYYPEQQVSLPGHIEMKVVDENQQSTTISLSLQTHILNRLYVDPDVTWRMPTPADVPSVDLSTLDPNSANELLNNTAAPVPQEMPKPARGALLRGFDLR